MRENKWDFKRFNLSSDEGRELVDGAKGLLFEHLTEKTLQWHRLIGST